MDQVIERPLQWYEGCLFSRGPLWSTCKSVLEQRTEQIASQLHLYLSDRPVAPRTLCQGVWIEKVSTGSSCRVLWLIKTNQKGFMWIKSPLAVYSYYEITVRYSLSVEYEHVLVRKLCILYIQAWPCLYWPVTGSIRVPQEAKWEGWKPERKLRCLSNISTHHNMDRVSRRHQWGAAQRVH